MLTFTDAAIKQLATALGRERNRTRSRSRAEAAQGMSYVLNIETEFDEEDILLDTPGYHRVY